MLYISLPYAARKGGGSPEGLTPQSHQKMLKLASAELRLVSGAKTPDG